jgi:hypothetical protein
MEAMVKHRSHSIEGIVRETWASGLRGPASPDLSIIDVTRLSR